MCYVLATAVSLTLPKVTLALPDKTGQSFKKTVSVLKKALPSSFLIFIYGIAVCAVTAFLAVFCEEKALPGAANFFVISTIGTLASRMTTGRIYDRFGHYVVVVPAIILITLAVIMIFLIPPAIIFYVSAVIYGLGVGSLFPAIQALTLSSVPMKYRTGASAFFYNSFDIGIGLGTLIMGLAAGSFQTFAVVYLLSGLFMTIMLGVYFYFYSQAKNHSPKKKS
jgi:MFS family permease